MRFGRNAILLWAFASAMILSSTPAMAGSTSVGAVATLTETGASATLLPNNDVLLAGGRNASGLSKAAYLSDPQAGAIMPVSAQLNYARAWHTATLLPDGSVFVFGGIGVGGKIAGEAERLNVAATAFEAIATVGLTSRAYHSATLLTDGRVLIVGGIGADGGTLGSIQLWDFSTGQSSTLPVGLLTPRSKQTATLLPDGTVLIWGGVDARGELLSYGEIIDPISATVRMQSTLLQPSADSEPPSLEASLPQNGATGVPVNVLLSMRFSKQLSMSSVNVNTALLTGPEGVVSVSLVPAEGGMLLFVTPTAALVNGTQYTLSLTGLTDNMGQSLPNTSISFTTTGNDTSSADAATSSAPGTSSNLSGQDRTVSTTTTSASSDTSSSTSGGPTQAGSESGTGHDIRVISPSVTPISMEQMMKNIRSASKPTKTEAVHAMASGGGSACGGGSSSAPEIQALANALGNDPDLIYQYVHDNIEFSPIYGPWKGAQGTLLDGRGSAFDQAALMVALLGQACSNGNTSISYPSIVYGTISPSLAQLECWLNITNNANAAASAGNVLANGLFPFIVGGSNIPMDIGHAWVQVSINGTAWVFDPSFKAHNPIQGNLGALQGAMVYSHSDLPSAANAAVTADSVIIQPSNRATVLNKLVTYETNLKSYIGKNMPTAGVSDLLGGTTIVPTSLTNGVTIRQAQLPYQSGTWSDPGHVTFSISFLCNNQIYTTSPPYDSDFLYGQRLSIFFLNGSYTPTLSLNGSAPIISGCPTTQGKPVQISYSVNIPWDGPAGYTGTKTQTIWAYNNTDNGGYIIMNGWDQVGRGMIEKHRKLLQQAQAMPGAAANSEPVLGESLEMLGFTWLAENAAQQHMTDQILGTTTDYFFGIGVVGEGVYVSPITKATIVGPYVDLPMNEIGAASRNSGTITSCSGGACYPQTANSLTAFLDESGVSSSFESAVLEQTQAQVSGGFVAASTVKVLDEAVKNGNTIYDINGSSNWSAIQAIKGSPGSLTGYAQNDLSNITSWVNCGNRVIAPNNGSTTIGAWSGVGFKTLSTSAQVPTGSGSCQTVGGEGYGEIISGPLNGGDPGSNDPPEFSTWLTGAAQTQETVSWDNVNGAVYTSDGSPSQVGDPLDHVKGSYIYKHDDLTIGSKGFPYGLTFERSYDSNAQGTAGPLGNGWTHNYAISASVNSDGFTRMGQGSLLNAVNSIVALYVSSDLINGQAMTGQQNLENFVLEAIVNRWFTDQLTNNVINVTQGWNTEEFVKMADASYTPPVGSATILTGSPGNYTYRTKAGITMNFNTACATANCTNISTWSNAAGATVNFSYSGGVLSGVKNSATSRQLTLSYSAGQVSSVSDGTRSVSYGYTGGNLTSFTDALSQNTTFKYDTGGSYDTAGHLTQVFYPSNPTNPFVTNFYDALGRVFKQNDANSNVTLAFFAGSRTEIDDPVGNRHVWYNDPLGNVLEEIQGYGSLNLTTVNT
jgi:hypothetical protein